MSCAGAVVSVDALLCLDPAALDDTALKEALGAMAQGRARLDAAEAALIREFDGRGAYLCDGAVNAKAWLAHHTGVARAVAGARVLLAKRLARMPAMAESLGAGRVTAAHARALGRCLTPRTLEAFARDEAELTAIAATLEADDFEKVITRWLALHDADGPDPGTARPSELRASRHFGGRSRLDGDLDVEDSAEFLAELEAIYDELWRADRGADGDDPLRGRSRAERNAAALIEMARRSSAAGDRDDDPDDEADDEVDDKPATADAADQPDAEPDTEAPTAEPKPAPPATRARPRPRRPQLVVVVDPAALTGDWAAGRAELDDGTLLPRDTLERWACDSGIGRVVMGGRSIPFDLGRVTYTPSAGQRRALVARDRGCIVPGCKRKARWCDAHHVVPWPRGGTDLANLVLVCKRHHKQIHARLITLERDPDTGRWIALRADGTPVRQRPPPRLPGQVA